MSYKEIIKKWYKKIGFPSRYDKEFCEALETYEIDTFLRAADYGITETDGKKNFLYFLYFCEELQAKYKEKGIPDDILDDTLADMPRWLDTWSGLMGGLYFGELDWFHVHFTMKLFKIGRLQYCMAKASKDIPQKGIKKGDNVIDVHIPAAGPLTEEECAKSLDMARAFFEKYYPEFQYKYFSCHSWLLDEGLVDILGEGSNIIKFQKLFDIIERFETNAILSYTLRWKIKREEVASVEATSNFAKKVKDLALKGETFYGGYGFIEK